MGYLFWGLISIQSLPGSASPSHYIQANYQVLAKLFQPPPPPQVYFDKVYFDF